jgi:hypothetical protein
MRPHRKIGGPALAAALALFGATGCLGTGAAVSPPVAVVTTPAPKVEVKPLDVKPICGTVRVYSPAEEKYLAEAVTALPKNSPIIPALGDYRRMREEARACRNFK